MAIVSRHRDAPHPDRNNWQNHAPGTQRANFDDTAPITLLPLKWPAQVKGTSPGRDARHKTVADRRPRPPNALPLKLSHPGQRPTSGLRSNGTGHRDRDQRGGRPHRWPTEEPWPRWRPQQRPGRTLPPKLPKLMRSPPAPGVPRWSSCSVGQVKCGQHLGGAEPDNELAGYAVALPELFGPLRPHVARGDHCRDAEEFARIL